MVLFPAAQVLVGCLLLTSFGAGLQRLNVPLAPASFSPAMAERDENHYTRFWLNVQIGTIQVLVFSTCVRYNGIQRTPGGHKHTGGQR
jgi:hypothetical protein